MGHQPETSNSSQNSTEISHETTTTNAQPHVHGPGCNHGHHHGHQHGHHHGHQHEMTPFVRSTPKVGANDPCPCGSGKKHKKCCRQ